MKGDQMHNFNRSIFFDKSIWDMSFILNILGIKLRNTNYTKLRKHVSPKTFFVFVRSVFHQNA